MKKLNLGKLKLVAEDVLQRNQMTTIYGGSGDCIRYYCNCIGSIGSWRGTYCSEQELNDAIDNNCEHEVGTCFPL